MKNIFSIHMLAMTALLAAGCAGHAPVAPVESSSQVYYNAPAAPTAPPMKLGESSWTVENMARAQGCTVKVGAELLSSNGPVELYRVQCVEGRMYQARCDYRQCHFQ